VTRAGRKARKRYDPARASVRTWLYRIATNACLTALKGRGRRPLPSGLGAPSDDPEAPLAPALDVPWLEPFPEARFDMQARADLRRAWAAAVQALPARQRAVLVLRRCWTVAVSVIVQWAAVSHRLPSPEWTGAGPPRGSGAA
jgi:RNA polymerase sigma-70 factor (ECF subfamily)